MAEIPCPRCRLISTAPDPGLSRWRCAACGYSYFLRRCAVCRRISYVSWAQGYNQSWDCLWCETPNAGFRQKRDPATATIGELTQELARYGSPLVTAAQPAAASRPAAVPPPVAVPPVAVPPVSVPPPVSLPETTLPETGPPVETGGRTARPGWMAPPRRRPRRAPRRGRTGLAVIAVLALMAGLTWAALAMGAPRANRTGGIVPANRTVSVTEGQVGAVDFQGVPGQLVIVGSREDQVRLTGELDWKGRAPQAQVQLDRVAGVLHLSYGCAPDSPCTGNLRLSVPAGAAIVVRQPSGRIEISGLAGSLLITAAQADITAHHLRTAALQAMVTSGRFDATFDLPPQRLRVELNQAQATVRLPGTVRYRIIRQIDSGSVDVQVPQTGTAGNTVHADIHSGQLSLLPSKAPDGSGT
ncbi:MAG: hypothetical protein ABSF03_30030 [Streptosporangiaceae bacterium]